MHNTYKQKVKEKVLWHLHLVGAEKVLDGGLWHQAERVALCLEFTKPRLCKS